MGDLEGMAWTGSAHDDGEHHLHQLPRQAHIVGNPLLETGQAGRDLCSNCHKDAIASHPRFEDKGIVFDRLSCHDCHDVHQLVRGALM